jgi:hypothetical protein
VVYDFFDSGSHTRLHHFGELGRGWRPERRGFLLLVTDAIQEGRAYMDKSEGWNNILSSAYITAVTYGSSILKDTRETMSQIRPLPISPTSHGLKMTYRTDKDPSSR